MNRQNRKDVLIQYLNDAGLDAQVVLSVLYDSIELGFIDWGVHKETIIRLLDNPKPDDMYRIVSNSETILQPLEAWMHMERNLNALRKESVSKYHYYESEYKCSQIQNFILMFKPY